LLGWRTVPESWWSGFCQALPDERRAPEGRVGLERIRGASYAFDVPAKQKRVLSLSRNRNELQVEFFAKYPFHCFGNLAVEPSLKPRDDKGVGDTNPCYCLC
jgi:hypothetical protein